MIILSRAGNLASGGSYLTMINPANTSEFSVIIETVTSTSGQQKGVGEDAIPASASFPAVYSDDFDTTPSESLGKYFADQGGSFQVRAKRLCARVRAYVCCASVHTLPEVAGDCSSQLVHPLCTCSDVLTYAHLCIPPHPTHHTHLLPLVRSHSC